MEDAKCILRRNRFEGSLSCTGYVHRMGQAAHRLPVYRLKDRFVREPCCGLIRQALQECNALINTKDYLLSEQGKKIVNQIREYAKQCMLLLPQESILLCTSDIIESAFAKYKNFSSDNKMACVTRIVLSLAAITSEISPERTKIIMEKVKLSDIEKWDKENIGLTTLKKKISLLSAV